MVKIHNTLTNQKEEFTPIEQNNVRMFVCGPTVYDYIHIGNARTFVFFDVVAKYLKSKAYNVTYIQNITDIDNKIIDRAQKEGAEPLEYAKKYTEIFQQDMSALGVTSPEYKNATDHISEVINQVQTLLDKGNAYALEGDGIYFDLSTFPEYGKLSKRTANMADDAVSRIDDSDKKRNRGDFAIWKFSQPGDPSWPAPFGDGRPGWHIEDTAITERYFGPQYDIHGGGQDLIFPHHEAEIAQQESASGKKPFVKYWLHVGFLQNKEQKMSKSTGNFKTVHELLGEYLKEVLRFYLLSAHYRSPLDFNQEIMDASKQGIDKIKNWLGYVDLIIKQQHTVSDGAGFQLESFDKHFEEAMADDFNTSSAMSTFFSLINSSNAAIQNKKLDFEEAKKLKQWLVEKGGILGIVPEAHEIPKAVADLADQRELARQQQNWEVEKRLKQQILELGFIVDDTPYGPLVKRQ